RLGHRVPDAPRMECDAGAQERDARLRVMRVADSSCNASRRLAGGPDHRAGRFRASCVVSEFVHDRLRHVLEKRRRDDRRARRHGGLDRRNYFPVVLWSRSGSLSHRRQRHCRIHDPVCDLRLRVSDRVRHPPHAGAEVRAVAGARMNFIHDDFLLESDVARDLYHRFVERLPIIDYHCHLPVAQIASDHQFRSITEIWMEGDHYKWRAMRANGVAEQFCTGDANDWEKFEAWARTVPATLRNPLYHWTHLELKRPFGVTE